ncbi:hypothetical protein OC834_005074 [Tilletia horrida]|nr:hypothetical protein OC834_005074 [Tilletia horrida]KAK0535452.1 hypothetical protein OC835_002365 [Tilletia horrida]
MSAAATQPRMRLPPLPPRQPIETIVIEDSDSDPDMPEVVGESINRSALASAANKDFHLPGPGQRGQLAPSLPTRRGGGGGGQQQPLQHNHSSSGGLSERAKAKSRALDPPLPSSLLSPAATEPLPYHADPNATPISLPLLSTYNCPICFCPPVNAVTTPCGHVFCGSCLFDALLTQNKKKQEEDLERRIFVSGRLSGWSLPYHLPPALTEAHLGLLAARRVDQQQDIRARTSLRATANANAAASASAAGGSSNAASSSTTGGGLGVGGSSNSSSNSRISASHAAGHSIPASSSAATSNAASGSSSAAQGSASGSGSAASDLSNSNFMNGARAAAQNAFDRLRPFAFAMFHPLPSEFRSASPADGMPPSSQGSSVASSDRYDSPPPSSVASSSSGSGSGAGMAYPRPHPGMTVTNPLANPRSASPGHAARALHNLAGICPLCRGQIAKGFNVNRRSRPPSHKGKVVGLRLTLGRPVDDPFSVSLERSKKRLHVEIDELESDDDICLAPPAQSRQRTCPATS